jgi:hypothetical protein
MFSKSVEKSMDIPLAEGTQLGKSLCQQAEDQVPNK